MKKLIKQIVITSSILAAVLFSGCSPDWETILTSSDGPQVTLDHQVWESYQRFAGEEGILFEQILYGMEFTLIEKIAITTEGGEEFEYPWDQTAWDARLTEQGTLSIAGQRLKPSFIRVVISPWSSLVETGIIDIAPTGAATLGLPAPEISTGSPLETLEADHLLLIFLDGFGYLRYTESLEAGLIPVLGSLNPPLLGLTTYPPITSVSTASLLTGSIPDVHGVETRGVRKTDQQTLLEIASRNNLQVSAVEGEALAFHLKGAALELSGDRDSSGGTDDNVLANTLKVLEEGMPDLFYVHFHGIDDLGHEVGPGAASEKEKIEEVDQAVGEILQQVPSGTLVIIFADHGMHLEEGEERQGNHGHLIPRDMLIPIWMKYLD